MSGAGKSTALHELGRRGFRVVDADTDEWSEWAPSAEWLWREDRIAALLDSGDEPTLYVAGCVANQAHFYDGFDAVVLLNAPGDALLERIASRTTNDYGKDSAERERIVSELEWVVPRLRATCTHELDATRPPREVADELVAIGSA